MSRKSENSAANSAGDGDPVLSSFDNSPRKPGTPYNNKLIDTKTVI